MGASSDGFVWEECSIGISMVGRMYESGASCAASGASVGGWEEYIAIGVYLGTSIEDMDDDGSDDGRAAWSGTCPPPCWRYGTMGTDWLAFVQMLEQAKQETFGTR
jgi:hypothetical protein